MSLAARKLTQAFAMSPHFNWLCERGAATLLDGTINILAPLALYYGLRGPGGAPLALAMASAPPLIACAVSIIRHRRLDALSIFTVAGILLSLAAFACPATVLEPELGQKAGRMIIGIAFLGSAVLGRPLIFPLAQATAARESPSALARFEALRGSAHLHRTLMVMTLVWSAVLLGDVALSTWMIFHMSPERYASFAPLLSYGTPAALMSWTLVYRHSRRRAHGALH